VKAYAERAGLDPVLFAGHSLRSGFLTSAAEAGASAFKMMEVSRHKAAWLRPTGGSVPRTRRSGVPQTREYAPADTNNADSWLTAAAAFAHSELAPWLGAYVVAVQHHLFV
jgi:hypothetical protein